jgi:WD40 repeat protein
MIASASFDGKVIIWQSQDQNATHWDQIASLEGHDNEVKSVAWSRSGVWLATCGRDKRVWVWERTLESDFECVAMLDGHTQDVKFVTWHPQQDILMSCSYDDTIKVWVDDGSDWRCSETMRGHDSTVWGLAFDIGGSRIVTCSDDKSLILWSKETVMSPDSWCQISKLKNLHEYPIYSIDWSHEHGHIATGAADNAITICRCVKADDSIDMLEVKTVLSGAHDGDINCVRWCTFASHSNLLLSCGDDGCLKLWRYNGE